MVPNQSGRLSFLCSTDNRALQNEPTSTADSATEDMAGEADEPPDPILISSTSTDSIAPSRSHFRKSPYASQKRQSLLTRILHTSESDSHVDEDDYAFYEPNRALSSASTYSRSSAVSMAGLTSDDGLTSPHTSSPSPPIQAMKYGGTPPIFKQNSFQTQSTITILKTDSIDPTHIPLSDEATEQKIAAGLGRKRCITFFCGGKEAAKAEALKRAQTMEEPKPELLVRKSTLKFDCPLRDGVAAMKSRTRMSSPPPPARRIQASPKQTKPQTVSTSIDSIIPTTARKLPAANLRHRESFASDISETEATRFHEFASSKEEDDEWTNEATCYQRRLTVEDTLEIENGLRKLAREVEDEEDEEDEDEEQVAKKDDSDADDDEDEEEEEEENEDNEDEEDDDDEFDRHSIGSGFQTDDELGFARSEDESDGGSDYDWWAPGGAAVRENVEVLRSAQRRRNSASSVESENGAIPISPHIRRMSSRPLEIQRQPFDLPDSTDFVCGTLDEDKPLEQAFINRLAQRRAAKHKLVPQDIDPTFPTSDNDEDEEDEVSEHDDTESDHPMLHGQIDLHEDSDRHPHRLVPKKRSPLGSPRRLRSPPPAKRISLHRSPPPPTRRARSPPPTARRVRSPLPAARRARSPAPCALYRTRLSSSVPRKHSKILIRQRQEDDAAEGAADEDQDNTPRFNRGAIDIVRGLEKKRDHRQQKLLEKHCRKTGKSAKHQQKKHLQPGKGVERMRDVGIGLNEYRGIKCAASTPKQGDAAEVHMLSY